MARKQKKSNPRQRHLYHKSRKQSWFKSKFGMPVRVARILARKKNLPALPTKSASKGSALSYLHSGTGSGQQNEETLGIDYLEIPCSIASKPDRVAPLLLGDVDKFGAMRNMRYQCNECTRLFRNRRSWEKHKGIRWITDNQTEICT